MKMKIKNFTLVELLVVIAVISILLSLLLPQLNKTRRKAKTVLCCNNYKQNIRALLKYTRDNNGRFPKVRGTQTSWLGQKGTGWYNKKKLSIEVKPLNIYLGRFKEGDTVPTSRCPETLDDDYWFNLYGTDYDANNSAHTYASLSERHTRFLSEVSDASRMVALYEEAVYEQMYSAPVPDGLYKHSDIGQPLFNLGFVDGSVIARTPMMQRQEWNDKYSLRNDK